MVLITCKKCGDTSYLTSEGLGNLPDFGFKCRNCDTINRISLADGETQKARIVRKPTDECGNYSMERT